jgi:hypothetical protein
MRLNDRTPYRDYWAAVGQVVGSMINQVDDLEIRCKLVKKITADQNAIYDASPTLERGQSLTVLHCAEHALVKLVSQVKSCEVEALFEYW